MLDQNPMTLEARYRALIAKEHAAVCGLADLDDPEIAAYLARLDAVLAGDELE
jgi:hypothetical protein